MSQFDLDIAYIRGEDNPAADALSRIPANSLPSEQSELVNLDCESSSVESLSTPEIPSSVNTVLSVAADPSILNGIREGYKTDPFCEKLKASGVNVPGFESRDGLWFFENRLYVPNNGSLREDLFRAAHDSCGHVGSDKAYANLCNSYYWPKMRKELYELYVPGCEDCQRNKGRTSNSGKGPLHPLPVPERRGDSVGIDFIGPLPLDEGFDCIATMTDRLNADLKIVPTRTNITAEEFAELFFEHWYCDNGLPLEIVGVKLKMSSAFHPQTDGASERTNKSVNQAIRFFVERNQRGWVKALPHIRFNLMNSVVSSTGL